MIPGLNVCSKITLEAYRRYSEIFLRKKYYHDGIYFSDGIETTRRAFITRNLNDRIGYSQKDSRIFGNSTRAPNREDRQAMRQISVAEVEGGYKACKAHREKFLKRMANRSLRKIEFEDWISQFSPETANGSLARGLFALAMQLIQLGPKLMPTANTGGAIKCAG